MKKEKVKISYKNYFVLRNSWLKTSTFIKKFRNSFLNFHFLWPICIRDKHFDDVLVGREPSKISKVFLKIFRFWPRVIEASNWSSGDVGKKGVDPADFKKIDPHSQILVDEIFSRLHSLDDHILDLGCNCGRFLAPLAEQGCGNLYGVDISQKALDYMPEWFPVLKDKVEVRHDLFQRYLSSRNTKEFDIVYTHGATVELVHPSYPLIREICRVTKRYVIFVINENDQRFQRFWEYEFQKQGFVPVHIVRPITQDVGIDGYEHGHPLSLMVFYRLGG